MKSFSKSKEITAHIFYWIIFLIGHYIQLDPKNAVVFTVRPFIVFDLSFLFMIVSTFYLNYNFILRKFFDINTPSKYLLGVLVIFAYFILTRYLIDEIIFLKIFGTGNYFQGTTFWYYVFDNIHWGSSPIIVSTIMWLVINHVRTLQNEVTLNEEKKKAEIQFLKSQINPHFIFNTLNNIYSMVVLGSAKSLSAIEKLSEIMRFTTYETQKELIPVSSEIKYIESYVELEKIRNSKQIQIITKFEIADENQLIPPYILLPFIENIIKHARIDDPKNPVEFSISINEKQISVNVHNQITTNLKDSHSGIGISNLKKRLEHYYPNKHQLQVSTDGKTFSSSLQINL